ncbi:unnamed protein product [Bursaphelenchus xylophilus]|uniref:ditrans,polycis-polyprenyl diphosphate synthase [(2E,6E)-farnesyldiphosphate specific] n=1 Tax=Bursaphelenchus xylophilus TaxID=6326 RepID=A0A1I7S977_BURXY|nr:unnamed protein product [Bursaphelenchus xylophilus]CAG9100417.1 unnamed protein product [Bursaphelenchus xylophilus]
MSIQQCLSTLILFVFSSTLWVISRVQEVFSFQTLKMLAQLVGASYDEGKQLTDELKIPPHVAVLLGEEQKEVDLQVLYDFIYYSSSHGMQRLSFYDSDGILKSMMSRIEDGWERYSKQRGFFKNVVFSKSQDGNSHPGRLTVHFWNKNDGRELMVDICKELIRSPLPITTERVSSKLASKGVHEVDFLLAVGGLDGFPAWALRVAEIQELAAWPERLNESSYRSLLRCFSSRDRRLGR